MFFNCHVFNQDISKWDVSKVNNMYVSYSLRALYIPFTEYMMREMPQMYLTSIIYSLLVHRNLFAMHTNSIQNCLSGILQRWST